MDIESIIQKCINSEKLTREEIIFLLNLEDKSDMDKLFSAGDTIRRKYCGDDVQIRALLELSNVCARHCNYCGIRADNHEITRYRIEPDEIVDIAIALNGKGLKTIVMQSGEDPILYR